jgi:hypothetical protein
MWKSTFCWGLGLLLVAGGQALSQTRPAQTTTPVQPAQVTPRGPEMRGKIVRIDPQTGMVVIRQGTGANAKDVTYRVGKNTRYYGTANKMLTDGLRYNGFKQWADVWYSYVPANATGVLNLNELRLGPTVGTTPGGTRTAPGGVRPGGSGR